jgi:hypothetical protein
MLKTYPISIPDRARSREIAGAAAERQMRSRYVIRDIRNPSTRTHERVRVAVAAGVEVKVVAGL